MVLADLGNRLTNALRQMANNIVVDQTVLDNLLKEVCSALLQADVNVHIVKNLRDNIRKAVNLEEIPDGLDKRRVIQKAVVDELCKMLDPGTKPFQHKKGKQSVVMFVGLQGSGKTTTCTKYALHYQKKGFKTGLVCADTFRAGAFDQLKQNATKAKIPFYGSHTESDPVAIAKEGVDKLRASNFDIIIVDTSGRHKQETELFEEMKQVEAAVKPDEIIFVVDSSIGQAAYDQARAFHQSVSVGSIIITKMDGHAKGGGALSAVAATKSPIIFIGTGEHLDEMEAFSPKSFISRLLGQGDIHGLITKIKDAGIDQNPEKYMSIAQGKFTLRDLQEQFQNLMKMGPIGNFMNMIPGFQQDMIPKGREKEGMLRIKRFICMMDSMTNDELDDPKLMNPSRIARIARGSGRHVREVSDLLEEFKRIQKVVAKMKNLNLGKMGDLSGPRGNASLAQMSKLINPQMLKQMGGMSGLQNMMKQFGNMTGFGGPGGPGMPPFS